MIPAITEPGSDREQLTSLARTCSGIGDAIPTAVSYTHLAIGKELGKDRTTISKEIKKYSYDKKIGRPG